MTPRSAQDPGPTPQAPHRARCPECDTVMSKLAERTGDRGLYQAYTDPVDGALMHRCKVHGRVAVYPNGRARMEAT